ncbi:MAG: flagellar type III secretion system protein FliR [Deltaproteobacteria bacterium]|nr:flagellar type III secretion system protein FliR [Deltaproteobacteria bacterium]
MATFSINLEQLQMFFLVFLRVAAVMMSIPVFGGKKIPATFKAGLALSVSILLFPKLEIPYFSVYSSAIPFVIGVASEILLGVIIGLSVNLIFAGIQLAGQLAGFQMGFALANVMDPQTGNQSSIIAGLLNITAILLFLSLNAHHWFLRGLVESFTLVPIFGFNFSGSLFEHLIKIAGNMFIIAVKVAAPVMAALLLTSVSLGLVARTVQGMNIFLVAMPLKIVLGLIFIGISLPFLASFLKQIFNGLGNNIILLLKVI